MRVRVFLLASVSVLVAESGLAYAEDSGSYTTELPPVEVQAPKTAAKPTRPRTAGLARAVRPAARQPVTRLRAFPTTPVSSPSTALAVDKVPSSINFVDAPEIQRTNSLNVTDALQQSVPAVNISEVTGNPFQPNVEFRGYVGSPVSGTPQGLACTKTACASTRRSGTPSIGI